jgi:hypothetical protein
MYGKVKILKSGQKKLCHNFRGVEMCHHAFNRLLFLSFLWLLLCVVKSHQEDITVDDNLNNSSNTSTVNNGHDDHDDHHHYHSHVPLSLSNYRLWLASTGSIVMISLCGIFGVLVIPIMHQVIGLLNIIRYL